MNVCEGDTREFLSHEKFKKIGHLVDEIIQEKSSVLPETFEEEVYLWVVSVWSFHCVVET